MTKSRLENREIFEQNSNKSPDMEFLGISLQLFENFATCYSQSLLNWLILKNTILYSGIKIHTKKSANQENSGLCINSIL